jgi:hypothetical protein
MRKEGYLSEVVIPSYSFYLRIDSGSDRTRTEEDDTTSLGQIKIRAVRG